MQIKPNETLLDGVVQRIDHAKDGIGATVSFSVLKNHASDPAADFVGAPAGATLDLFAAVPQEFEVGGRYQVSTALAGGPREQKVVVRSARKLGAQAR